MAMLIGVNGTSKHGANTYKYAEASWGTNRGITMTAQKPAAGSVTYKFNPNPHNADSWYNKNQQAFYQQAADAIAALTTVTGNVATFPPVGSTITVHKVTYTLGDR